MKNLAIFSLLGLIAFALVGCGGGMSTDDFKSVWKTAIDGYYKDLEANKGDASKTKDIQKRLDEAAKAKGAKDWTDLCTKVSTGDTDGYKKVTEEMTKYSTDAAKKFTEKMTKAATDKAKEGEKK